MDRSAHRYSIFESDGGYCGIAWSPLGLTRFQLPSSSAQTTEKYLLRRLALAERALPTPSVKRAISAAQRYFVGEAIGFSDLSLDLEEQSAFFRRVYEAARRIPWGSTTTYGALAKAIGGGPELARDVGQSMAQNPVPLIIPCHRVLAAGGKLGGFSAPGGSHTKLRMLELEGIQLGEPPGPQQTLAL